ncbi:MAG: hypothetical protein AAGM38_13445 [Pseudomonadota bacterium]
MAIILDFAVLLVAILSGGLLFSKRLSRSFLATIAAAIIAIGSSVFFIYDFYSVGNRSIFYSARENANDPLPPGFSFLNFIPPRDAMVAISTQSETFDADSVYSNDLPTKIIYWIEQGHNFVELFLLIDRVVDSSNKIKMGNDYIVKLDGQIQSNALAGYFAKGNSNLYLQILNAHPRDIFVSIGLVDFASCAFGAPVEHAVDLPRRITLLDHFGRVIHRHVVPSSQIRNIDLVSGDRSFSGENCKRLYESG